ncbi:MAG: radical SAM protein, partial [bacterium]|nr:radical SAM protein [bacterium]
CYEHAAEFSGADFVIRGPGEVAAFNLINSLTGKSGAELKTEIDFPEPSYHYYHKLISTPIISSIGCPFQCSFCASGLLSGRFRQRKPEIVVDEVVHYYFKRRVRHFAFFDDALLVNQQNHISLILQEIIDRNLRLNLHTPNGIHPREITEELAQKIFRSNFKTLRLSFETINKSRQQEMGNKVSEQALICAINYLEKAGYRRKEIDVYVMMGLPDQSVDEVVESMLFVVSLGAKVRLTSFSPIPGTRDWDRSIKQCNLADDLDPLLTNNSIYPLNRPDFPMETFQQLRNLSKALNYGLDQGINFFDNSELVGRFLKYLQKKGQSH